jgi:hypothetical protein
MVLSTPAECETGKQQGQSAAHCPDHDARRALAAREDQLHRLLERGALGCFDFGVGLFPRTSISLFFDRCDNVRHDRIRGGGVWDSSVRNGSVRTGSV